MWTSCVCASRGDVGSWVREAAVSVLPASLVLLCGLDPEGRQVADAEKASMTQLVIQALLKQSVERIARVREVGAVAGRPLTQSVGTVRQLHGHDGQHTKGSGTASVGNA